MTEELKTELTFHLTTRFTYAHQGDSAEASFIVLTDPSTRCSDECAELTQAFMLAIRPTRDRPESAEAPGPQATLDSSDIINIMYMCTDVKFPQVLRVAKRLFTSGIAMVDGEVKLTKNLLDKMSQRDLEEMLGQFMVDFTRVSQLDPTKADSSKGSPT